tara:strand:+ start:317 stop:484 length:168 start_codon:yes stop_codon:yes gene_type:complete
MNNNNIDKVLMDIERMKKEVKKAPFGVSSNWGQGYTKKELQAQNELLRTTKNTQL